MLLPRSMVCSNGLLLSSAFSVSSVCASDTVSPLLTSATACLRFAGVIRFTDPS